MSSSCIESDTPKFVSGPEKLNLVSYRGDSLGLQVRVWQDAEKTVPADLSEATVTAQVRSAYDSGQALDFDVSVVDNTINLTLDPKRARDLTPDGVWDVQVDWQSDDVSVQTIAGGQFKTMPDVTRPA